MGKGTIQAKAWRTAGITPFYFAVNKSMFSVDFHGRKSTERRSYAKESRLKKHPSDSYQQSGMHPETWPKSISRQENRPRNGQPDTHRLSAL